MKLAELKAKVYELTGFSTARQLKAKYEVLKALDMRRKASWEKAFALVQQQPNEFEHWLKNPPDEYKELFAEIETTSEAYSNQLAKARQLGKAVISSADDLEALAEESQDEADCLKQEVEATRRIAKQARLN